jgi:hypothetical protein
VLTTKGEWLVGIVVLVLLTCYVLLCYCFTTESDDNGVEFDGWRGTWPRLERVLGTRAVV